MQLGIEGKAAAEGTQAQDHREPHRQADGLDCILRLFIHSTNKFLKVHLFILERESTGSGGEKRERPQSLMQGPIS